MKAPRRETRRGASQKRSREQKLRDLYGVERRPLAQVVVGAEEREAVLDGRAKRALTCSECPVKTGTRTQVPETFRPGMPRILRLSLRSFCSSSVSLRPSSTMDPASGSTLNAIGWVYCRGSGNSTADP